MHYRIRSDDTQALNSDAGWAAPLDTPATVQAHSKFRVRFEVERLESETGWPVLKLQYRRNGSRWQDAVLYPEQDPNSAPGSPAVWLVASAHYREGDPTSDLLPASALPFERGRGMASAIALRPPRRGRHTEVEYALIIPTFHDGAGQNREGDVFEFRPFGGQSAPASDPAAARVSLRVPPGLIGGTFVECPNRIGPFQDRHGNLYAIQEPAETDNLFMVIKSTDGGKTWREQDGIHRPRSNDLEAVDAVLSGDELHIVHHAGRRVLYHVFRVSTHPGQPDSYSIRDEVIAAPITYAEQSAALEVLPGGIVHCFYARTLGRSGRIFYRTRNRAWGPEQSLDDQEGASFYGVAAVRGAGDRVHVVYASDRGEVYARSLWAGGELSQRLLLTREAGRARADRVPIVPPVIYEHAGKENVLAGYRKASDGRIYTRVISGAGEVGPETAASGHPVSNDQAQSRQPTALLAAQGSLVYLLYADAADEDVYRNVHEPESGWGRSALERGAMEADLMRGFVYTHPPALGGGTVLGYLVDNGSDGYTGTVRYEECLMPGRR